jgi:hypothetical protein
MTDSNEEQNGWVMALAAIVMIVGTVLEVKLCQ